MILRRLLACFALAVAPSVLLAQAPEVGHTCVSGCGGGSYSSGTHHVSQAEREKHIENVQFYHHYKRYHDDFMRYVKRDLSQAHRAAKAGRYSEASQFLQDANTQLAKDTQNSTVYHAEDFKYIPHGAFYKIDRQREASRAKINEESAKENQARAQLAQQQLARQQQLAQQHAAARELRQAPPTQQAGAATINNDSRAGWVPAKGGTALQQLKDAAHNEAVVAPPVNAVCTAQGGSGSWGACIPPTMAANQKAMKHYQALQGQRDQLQQQVNNINTQMTNINLQMHSATGDQAQLTQQYSNLSNQRTNVEYQERQKNDEMKSFLVSFEESDTAKNSPSPK
jgi:hypothetical protein